MDSNWIIYLHGFCSAAALMLLHSQKDDLTIKKIKKGSGPKTNKQTGYEPGWAFRT